jgi:hypothetical protein
VRSAGLSTAMRRGGQLAQAITNLRAALEGDVQV